MAYFICFCFCNECTVAKNTVTSKESTGLSHSGHGSHWVTSHCLHQIQISTQWKVKCFNITMKIALPENWCSNVKNKKWHENMYSETEWVNCHEVHVSSQLREGQCHHQTSLLTAPWASLYYDYFKIWKKKGNDSAKASFAVPSAGFYEAVIVEGIRIGHHHSL